MKSTIVLLIIILIAIFTKAQLNISTGVNSLFTSYPTMNKFRKSYNNYLADDIVKDFKSFTLGKGFQLGLTYELGIVYVNIASYNQLYYSRTVQYNSGNKRHFNLKYNYWQTGLGLGYGDGDGFGVWAFSNLTTGSTILKTYYEYADGSKDIGTSHQLNGIYSCIISMKPTIGIRISIPLLENISVIGQIEYMFNYNIRFKKGELRFYMNDINHEKLAENQLYELPTDYEAYWESGGTWSDYYSKYDNEYVEGDISGVSIMIGIKYNIPGTSIEL